MRSSTQLALVFLFLTAPFAVAQPVPDTCVEANGLLWCYDPLSCGEACNEVCAALGGTPVADSTAWFEAQNSEAECQTISQAFGLGTDVQMANWTYACLEDSTGAHTAPGGLLGPLYCSTFAGCPDNHRTQMDQQGNACGPTNSRRSVCPCENVAPVDPPTPVPTLSHWAGIIIVMILAALGLGTLRRRRA